MLAFARRRTSAVTEGLLIALLIALVSGLLGIAGQIEAAPSEQVVGPRSSVAAGPTRGHVLVAYRKDTSKAAKAKLEAGAGAKLITAIPELGVRVLSVPAGREQAAAKQLAASKHVRFAEIDRRATAADTTPNDPYFLSQRSTSLAQVKAPTAWDVTTGTPGFLVAVLDSGVSAHPDLAVKLVAGRDFVNGDNDPTDDNGHGTHVAGIIGAAANNATGVAGLCWGCNILPVKVLGADGTGAHSAIASGLVYAADQGAKVINLSLGGTTGSSTLKAGIDYAVGKGALVVAATGNQGCACVLYPAAYSNVIAVGAVDKYNVLRSYSNTGPEVDLVAPGSNWTTSTVMSSGYAAFSGTSSATPVVSSLAALAWSSTPSLSPSQLTTRLMATATDLGPAGMDAQYGAGIVDFAAAVGSSGGPAPSPTASPTTAPSPTPAPSPTATPSATPTPVPTPSPSATPAPSPTPTPRATPTPTPSPTPTPTATTATKTYKGNLSSRQTSKDFAITAGNGPLTASVSGGTGLTLVLLDGAGATVTTGQTDTAKLNTTVSAGAYVLRVSGSGAKTTFKLVVTFTKP